MASLPYVTSPGNIDKALENIKNAAVPGKVTQDFVKTILKVPGGSGDQMTAFLKKLGFASPDGSPSEIYKKFRNPSSSGEAISKALKIAYEPLYIRNEYMHELNEKQLIGLLVEETGLAHDSGPIKLIASCIKHLKAHASWDAPIEQSPQLPSTSIDLMERDPHQHERRDRSSVGLNLGYTINLNLPATADAAVFDAIFKSLKAHLLSEDDA